MDYKEIKMNADQFKDNEEIDLKEFFSILWKAKFKIVSLTIITSITSIFFALSIPNTYKSEAKLVPVAAQNIGMGGIGGQMGGIANLAGINLSSSPGQDKSLIAIEVLQSRKFFEDFYQKNNVLVPLLASKGWDKNSNEIILDDEVYDVENKKWIFDKEEAEKTQPSSQEAFSAFSDLFLVDQNKLTGFVSISVEHYSPYVAKQWLDIIINQINESIRMQDIAAADRSVGYLEAELSTSSLKGVQTNIYSLIQSQVEKKVLAQATPEYVFQVIDPPVIPENKEGPRRSLICIIGALLGAFLGAFISLFQHYFFRH